MANEKKYLDFAALSHYDEKLKAWVSAADAAADAKVLADAKDYADGLASNYDAAGTAATAEANAKAYTDALANGQVKTNTDAIAKLNGGADEDGSVAKAVADAKALIDADVKAVDDKAVANAGEITTLKGRMDTAEGDIDAIQEDVGNVDELETTNKELVKAINEVRNSVSAGGISSAVTMTTTTTTDGMLKSYTIKQGENVVGTIDIPKDMVVESGEVVTNPEGQPEGTYIKLVLANVAEPLYVNVGTLVDIYKAKADAAQVQIAIDSATREISASIVAGSITATELADNAVVTAKIADANVTKAKLSTEVQASLNKADAAATKAEFDEEVTRAKAAEAQALTDAKAYTDEKVGAEKTRAEGVEADLDTRLQAVEAKFGDGEGNVEAQIAAAVKVVQDDVDALEETHATDKKALEDADTAIKGRLDALEAIDHEHANKELLDSYTQTEANLADAVAKKHEHANATVLDGITAEKVAAWDASEQNAKDYADGLNDAMDERMLVVEGKAHEHANKAELDKIVEGDKAKWDAMEQNAKDYADGLNTAMNTRMEAVETKSSTNETNIGLHADRLDALEGKVGEGFVAITNDEIDTLFAAE